MTLATKQVAKSGAAPALSDVGASAAYVPIIESLAAPPALVVRHRDPLQRAREIRTMPVAELNDYAKQIGVRQRDIDELTEDRLRQNCMLTVVALVEAYTE